MGPRVRPYPGPTLTQRTPLLQVADEVLHVLGHVLGVVQSSIHTTFTALQELVYLLRQQAA